MGICLLLRDNILESFISHITVSYLVIRTFSVQYSRKTRGHRGPLCVVWDRIHPPLGTGLGDGVGSRSGTKRSEPWALSEALAPRSCRDVKSLHKTLFFLQLPSPPQGFPDHLLMREVACQLGSRC